MDACWWSVVVVQLNNKMLNRGTYWTGRGSTFSSRVTIFGRPFCRPACWKREREEKDLVQVKF